MKYWNSMLQKSHWVRQQFSSHHSERLGTICEKRWVVLRWWKGQSIPSDGDYKMFRRVTGSTSTMCLQWRLENPMSRSWDRTTQIKTATLNKRHSRFQPRQRRGYLVLRRTIQVLTRRGRQRVGRLQKKEPKTAREQTRKKRFQQRFLLKKIFLKNGSLCGDASPSSALRDR